ncbi:MAG: hypothetical protein ACYC2U_02845 [Candidatus Amoebophilus sp.]
MINGKFTHNLKFSFLITVFSLFIFTACGGCSSVPETPPLKVGDNKKSADNKKAPEKKINFKKVIVLFHGLGAPGDTGIAALREKLKNDIKNSEIIILDRNNSGSVPTTQQAGEAYQNLKRQLEQRQLAGNPVCLFGDSQGGLVALELYRLYKNDLHIVGIVTNHTPLEGAPGVNVKIDDVNKLQKTIKDKAGVDIASMLGNSVNLQDVFTNGIKEPVRKDLTEGSNLLNNVKSTLLNIQIPVLLLGGNVDMKIAIDALLDFTIGENPKFKMLKNMGLNLQDILNQLSSEVLEELKKNLGNIIGDKGQGNDCFIPYYSQMAQGLPDHPKVERFSSRSYHHFYGTAYHIKVYDKLRTFINQAFEDKK